MSLSNGNRYPSIRGAEVTVVPIMVISITIMEIGCDTAGCRNHHSGHRRFYSGRVPRPARPAPKSFSAHWPEIPCDDPTAEVARRLVVRLKEVLGEQSLRSLKGTTGVDHTTVSVILSGQVWPDIATLARLEAGLGADLWPGRIRTAQRQTVGQ
jgi:hypothetical protein